MVASDKGTLTDGRIPVLDETLHRALGVALAVATLVLYTVTCCRTVYWGDSGELIMAGAVLGVAHPPGHPLYTILAHLFSLLPFGGVAFRINWLSAVAGAAAVWLTYGFAAEALRRLGTPARRASWCAAAAAAMLALTTGMWDGATVAETTTLHAAFMAGVCWYVWRIAWDRPTGAELTRRLATAAFLYGLSATNHVAGIFFLPAFAVLLIGRCGVRVLAPKNVVAMFACVFAGLLLYVYLPLRSLQDPPLDWGNPETLHNFIWVITAKQYRANFVPKIGSVAAWTALGDRAKLIADEWSLIGAALIIIGWMTLARRQGLMALFILLALVPLLAVGLSSAFILAYFVPGLMLMAIVLAIGLDRIRRRLAFVPVSLFAALVLAVCGFSARGHYASSAKQWDRSAELYGRTLLDAMPENAVLLTTVMESCFAPWGLQAAEGYRTDVAVIEWTWATGNDPLRETVAERYPDIIFPTMEDLTPYAEKWGAETVRSDKGIGAMLLENVERRPLYVQFGEQPITIPEHLVPDGGFFTVRAEPGEYATPDAIASVVEYWERWDARFAEDPRLSDTQLGRNLSLDATIQGLVFEALKAPEISAELYARGARLDSTRALPRLNAGRLLAAEGQWQEALSAYQSAAAANPNFSRAYYRIGTALEALGRPDEAYAEYLEALALTPTDADVLRRAGDLMRIAGQYDRAEEYLQRGAAAAPLDTNVVRAQIRLSLARNELGAAAKYFQRAQSLNDTSVQLTVLLAQYASVRGQLSEARQLLVDARTQDPETTAMLLDDEDWARALEGQSIE